MLTLPVTAALVSTVGWSVLDVFRKRLTGRLNGLALVLWLNAALPPLALAAVLRDGTPFPGLRWLALCAVGVTVSVGAQVLFLHALRRTTLSAAAPMLALAPAFGAVFGLLLLHEALRPLQVLGLVVVVAGCALNGFVAGGRPDRGALMVVGVAALWATNTAIDKLGMTFATPAWQAFAASGLGVTGLLVVLAARGELSALRPPREERLPLAAASLTMAGAYGLQLYALTGLHVSQVEGMKRGLGVGLSLALGAAVFGERPPALRIALAVGIAAGVVTLLGLVG